MTRWQAGRMVVLGAGLCLSLLAQAQEKPVYRCPGNLYTDALSAKEAADKGCKTLDGAPITVIQSQPPARSALKPSAPGNTPASSPEQRVSPDDQKARDTDARRILEAELAKEDAALSALRKEFNNGEPERRGDERNAQKYIDRVNDMRNALIRKEADVVSIKRELAKLGGAGSGINNSR